MPRPPPALPALRAFGDFFFSIFDDRKPQGSPSAICWASSKTGILSEKFSITIESGVLSAQLNTQKPRSTAIHRAIRN